MVRLLFFYTTIGICLLFFDSCAQKSKDAKMIYNLNEDYSFPYSIYSADKEYVLESDLREISGLTYNNEKSLLCVNDEKGIVYKYHLEKEKITKKYKFEKSGDYEGLEFVGDDVYVLRSDGIVYKVKHIKDKDVHSKKSNTFLDAGNDTEGLAYDWETNSLLIACKGSPGDNKVLHGKRAIYSFDLEKNKLGDEPVYLIDQEKIRKVLEFNGYANFSVKILQNINPSEGDITFQPSGIAKHPITNNLYVIGSVGKLLIVLNPEGEIISLVKLKRKLFRQPEGICFAPDGTMFISNEGKGSHANIYKFNYKK